MNCRRIVMVPGSYLLKRICTTVASPASASIENSHLRKRACTTIAAPLGVKADLLVTNDGSLARAEKAKVAAREQRKKRKMFKELRIRIETVNKTLNALIKREEEDGVSITPKDLFRWSKHLDKFGKHKHACQIFEWMEKKKMTIPPSEIANYLGLIDKTKGLAAAHVFFERIEPHFNFIDHYAKHWPAFLKLAECEEKGWGNRTAPAVLGIFD